jgi:hypothetical protein
MKSRAGTTVILAILIYCTTATLRGAECSCSVRASEFSVTAYYVHWISLTVVALSINDVVTQAKNRCNVVHFRVSESYGVGPLLDSLLRSSRNADKTQCGGKGFDGRLVFVVHRRNQRDTIAFGRGSCMYVNKQYVPADYRLLRQLAEYLPRWQSEYVIGDSLQSPK